MFLAAGLPEGTPEIRIRGGLLRPDLALLLYPLGALVTGVLFFALAPLMRWIITAPVLGVLSFAPWTFAIARTIDRGYRDWTAAHTWIASTCAVLLGGVLGIGMRGEVLDERLRRMDRTRPEKAQQRPRSLILRLLVGVIGVFCLVAVVPSAGEGEWLRARLSRAWACTASGGSSRGTAPKLRRFGSAVMMRSSTSSVLPAQMSVGAAAGAVAIRPWRMTPHRNAFSANGIRRKGYASSPDLRRQ
jgi:hypothetical protein